MPAVRIASALAALALCGCELSAAFASDEPVVREPAAAVFLVRQPRPAIALQGLGPADPAPALLPGADGSELKPFATIAAALRAAPDGALLRLEDGEYRERVVIDRPVVILGRGALRTRILAPEGDGPGILVKGTDGFRLRGVRLEGGQVGLSLTGGHGHRLENVEFRGMRDSALVVRQADLVASGGEIVEVGRGVTGRAVDVDGGSVELHRMRFRAAGRRGIQVRGGSAVLDGLDFEGSGLSALQAVDGADVRVIGGSYSRLGGAALYAGAAKLAVEGAHVEQSEFSIVAFRGATLALARDDFTAYSVAGVALVNSMGSIEQCTISKGGTEAAISVTGRTARPIVLTDNRIHDPGPFGVHVTSASIVARGNTITGARLDREHVMGDAFFAVDGTLRIEDNVLRGNAGSGVVTIRSTSEVHRNGLIDNGRAGLLLLDSSKAQASGNWFDRNAGAGVEIAEGARAQLDRNRFGARGEFDIDTGCGAKGGYASMGSGNTFSSAPVRRECP